MKKIFTIILSLCSLSIFAQEPSSSQPPIENNDKKQLVQSIEALKVAYITKELNLSTDEAQKFWPLYNSFSVEMKKARIENKDDDIAFQEKKVVVMKKYKDDFKKLLNNDDRVKKCFRAEPEFHKLLKMEWTRRQMNRSQQHGGTGGGPQGINNSHPPAQQQQHQNHSAPNRGGRAIGG